MSADNYIVVRRFADGWRWGEGFASDEYPGGLPDRKFRHGPFVTPDEAVRDAEAEVEIIEYGINTWQSP